MVSLNSDKGRKLMKEVEESLFFERRDIQETIDGGNEQLVRPSARPVHYLYQSSQVAQY